MTNDMALPPGKTCGDCVHFKRCEWLIQCKREYTRCDWAPSRFREAAVDWIDIAARAIVGKLPEWENESGQLAAHEESEDAGIQYLVECISKALREHRDDHAMRNKPSGEAAHKQ